MFYSTVAYTIILAAEITVKLMTLAQLYNLVMESPTIIEIGVKAKACLNGNRRSNESPAIYRKEIAYQYPYDNIHCFGAKRDQGYSYFAGVPFLLLKSAHNWYRCSCWVLPMGNPFLFSYFFYFSINATGSLDRIEYCSKFLDVLFK